MILIMTHNNNTKPRGWRFRARRNRDQPALPRVTCRLQTAVFGLLLCLRAEFCPDKSPEMVQPGILACGFSSHDLAAGFCLGGARVGLPERCTRRGIHEAAILHGNKRVNAPYSQGQTSRIEQTNATCTASCTPLRRTERGWAYVST